MTKYYDKDTIKDAAKGRWLEIILAVCGISPEKLDGQHQACPKCGGTDRFRAFDDFADTGGLMCGQCHSAQNGDGYATIMWLNDCDFTDAVKRVAEQLGIAPTTTQDVMPVMRLVERAKSMPIESMKAFGGKETKRGKLPVVRFPVYNSQGESHSYFDLAPREKGWFKRGKGNSGIFLPGRLPQPDETWLLTEGVKDAAVLHGLGFNAMGMPSSFLAAKYARLLQGCDVICMPDRDKAAHDGALKTGANLMGVARSIRVAALPAPMTPTKGKDVRDILKSSDEGEKLLRQAIDDATPWSEDEFESSDANKPEIIISPDEERIADEAIKVIAKRRLDMFQRAGQLVHVVLDAEPPKNVERPDNSLRICRMPPARIREILANEIRWIRISETQEGESETVVHPPAWAVSAIECRGSWQGIPSLAGIVESPVIRADGSVLQSPGYDKETGLLFHPTCEFPAIPNDPNRDDVIQARDQLLETVCDFPFTNEVHKASWLAALLTNFARHAYYGPTPLFAIDANVRGSGKSLLADVIAVIRTGQVMPRTSAPKDDEEMRKRLTSVFVAAEPMLMFDNIAGTFGYASLDAALTAATWSDRILGSTEMTGSLPINTVFLATGNNMVFGADTARRILHIRIESDLENPETRTGFRHPRLVEWVRQNRGQLVAAAVTILRGYFKAGKPDQGIPQWGSFESWSDGVRNAVVWADLPDPGETRTELQAESDRSANELRLLIAGWEEADPDNHGMTVSEALRKFGKPIPMEGDPYPTLRSAIDELSSGKPNSRSIGMRMHHFGKRVCGGKQLVKSRTTTNTTLWTVKTAGSSGSTGSAYALRGRDKHLNEPVEGI